MGRMKLENPREVRVSATLRADEAEALDALVRQLRAELREERVTRSSVLRTLVLPHLAASV